MRRYVLHLLVAALFAAQLAAQARDERESSVGMRALIQELVLPGSELVAAPSTHEAPIVLRLANAYRHGDRFRYDVEWTGLEPGSFDLRDFLERKDGSTTEDLPAIEVSVSSVLDPSAREPSGSESKELPRFLGYETEWIVIGAVWLVGLLLILFIGRKRRAAAPTPHAKPTLADRLRPFVEAAAQGHASEAEKAELERLLLAYWRVRLGLTEDKADRALAVIREHEQAGALLRQLDAWLHMPEPPEPIDVSALLSPYRDIAADAIELRDHHGARDVAVGDAS